ncbi:hypothetical protein [Burkholderia pseudomallei]|uniref:hypothetical protein n=1 Tax=Burkholderia pseudomallei TaxID=28450 RepID=UPI0030EAE62A
MHRRSADEGAMRMAGSNARRPAFASRDGRRVVSIGLTALRKSCARSRRAQPFRTISTDAERTYRAARTACARSRLARAMRAQAVLPPVTQATPSLHLGRDAPPRMHWTGCAAPESAAGAHAATASSASPRHARPVASQPRSSIL